MAPPPLARRQIHSAAGEPLARQPVARRCKRPDAAQPRQFRRPGEQGRWDRLRPRVRGTDGGGLETRDNPQQAPKKDDFRLDRLSGRRPTPLSPHPKTGSRRFGRCVPLCSAPVLPCSGCRREAKRAFEKPIAPGDQADGVAQWHCAQSYSLLAPRAGENCRSASQNHRVALPGFTNDISSSICSLDVLSKEAITLS